IRSEAISQGGDGEAAQIDARHGKLAHQLIADAGPVVAGDGQHRHIGRRRQPDLASHLRLLRPLDRRDKKYYGFLIARLRTSKYDRHVISRAPQPLQFARRCSRAIPNLRRPNLHLADLQAHDTFSLGTGAGYYTPYLKRRRTLMERISLAEASLLVVDVQQ